MDIITNEDALNCLEGSQNIRLHGLTSGVYLDIDVDTARKLIVQFKILDGVRGNTLFKLKIKWNDKTKTLNIFI